MDVYAFISKHKQNYAFLRFAFIHNSDMRVPRPCRVRLFCARQISSLSKGPYWRGALLRCQGFDRYAYILNTDANLLYDYYY